MEISKKTWHYRLVEKMYCNSLWDNSWRLEHFGNLCCYGRRVIAAFTVFPLLALLLAPGFLAARIMQRRRLEEAPDSTLDVRFNSWVVMILFYILALDASTFWTGAISGQNVGTVEGPVWLMVLYVGGQLALIVTAVIAALWIIALSYIFLRETDSGKVLVGATANAFKGVGNRAKRVASGDGFIAIMITWAKAKKQKVCPAIKFVD